MDEISFVADRPSIKTRPLSTDRICACGNAFRGEVARCVPCRKKDREWERICACGVFYVGNRTMCSDCNREDSRKYYEENKNTVLAKHRDKKLGLEEGWYAQRVSELDGKCAACGVVPLTRSGSLAVDHDHSCCAHKATVSDPLCGNCTRDLLCINCNTVLGMVNDDVDRLMGLVAYLLRFQDVLVPVQPNITAEA